MTAESGLGVALLGSYKQVVASQVIKQRISAQLDSLLLKPGVQLMIKLSSTQPGHEPSNITHLGFDWRQGRSTLLLPTLTLIDRLRANAKELAGSP